MLKQRHAKPGSHTLPSAIRPALFQRMLELAVDVAPFRWKLSERLILIRTDIIGATTSEFSDGLEAGWADETDIKLIATHPEGYGSEVYNACVGRGDKCFCLKKHGEIVTYNWVAFRKCCLLCGFRSGVEFLPLLSNQVFTYGFYTYSKHRNKGLGTLLKSALYAALKRQDVDQVYSLIAADNPAPLRVHLHVGGRPERVVYAFRLRRFARVFLGQPNDPGLLSSFDQLMTASAKV
jgi:GNAT superfamily N-acetyltransferase